MRATYGNDGHMTPFETRIDGRLHAGGTVWRAASLLGLVALAAVGVSACGTSPEGSESADSSPSPAERAAENPSPLETGVPPLVCGTASPPPRPDPPRSGSPVTITDRAGHVWDISAAVYKYGFEADQFDYGLGVNVIRPINGPSFLASGDDGYPDAGEDFPLVGVERGGEARAYPIGILTSHEIVNDVIGDAHLAVSY